MSSVFAGLTRQRLSGAPGSDYPFRSPHNQERITVGDRTGVRRYLMHVTFDPRK